MQTNSNINSAEVWSQPNCTWCTQAKKLLESSGIPYVEKMIGSNGITKEDFFKAAPGARTVPQIVLNGKLVGGFEELRKALASDNTKTTKVL